jgi:hypothetical protein
MDTNKIKELISELQEDIRVKEEAIRSLQKLLSSINGRIPVNKHVDLSDNLILNDSFNHMLFSSDESYVDLAVKLIKANNRPLSVSEIVDQIRTLKNNPHIERRSVEATLHQHAANSKSPRLLRMAPGTYGLTPPKENTAA